MKNASFYTALALTCILGVCGCARTLTEEQKKEVEALRQTLTSTQAEITDAEQKQKVAGGLLGAMAGLRVETLKTNRALTEQRIAAIESGAEIKVIVQATAPDNELAEQVTKEIIAQEQSVASAREDAKQYGGLIGMMKLTTVATHEVTLAQLRQKYLMAKYGIALPLTSKQGDGPSAPAESKPAKSSKMVAGDGPFGLVMGLSESMFNGTLNELKPGVYEATDVPTPNKIFSKYIVRIGPNSGLCWIKAIGVPIPANSFGSQLRSQFDDIEGKLTERYGQGKKMDGLIPGSIWRDSNDWMMGLAKEERILSKVWEAGPKSTLSPELLSVYVGASALSGSEGRINVEYAFKNEKECEKEISAGSSKGL